ncbi:MAG: hypothetical protein EHM58_08160 [Ignavibacteriae bacterium]|nr:MAG: hypothetical protein EHM58_08160 [Ignavibacteriota bacterium]
MKNISFYSFIFLFLLIVSINSSGCKKQDTASEMQKPDSLKQEEFVDSLIVQPDNASDTVNIPVTNSAEKQTIKDTAIKQVNRRIIVYYFHATTRCVTCINIENYTQEVVNTKFRKEMKNKKVYFKSVNFETSPDEHIIEKFNLTSSSVILAMYEGKKRITWKNLEDVWDLEHDKEQFSNYIEDELKHFLKKLKEIET